MPLLTAKERATLRTVSQLCYHNPFLPERIAYERVVLGADFCEDEATWNMRGGDESATPLVNPQRLLQRITALVETVWRRFPRAAPTYTESDLLLYEDAVFVLLYYRYQHDFYQAITTTSPGSPRYPFYTAFQHDWEYYFHIAGFTLPTRHEAAHLFACFFQARRAFHHIFRHIIGGSPAAMRLRAAVWQSIFTHDMQRYRRTLYTRMADFTTLITGPSGTGKELVAQAIGLSRYVPFDARALTFAADYARTFHAINLSALPTTLIESELFGHRCGAFTGAVQDRRGWLEVCSALGTVFVDEVGDLEVAIQVKLLRVLQTRTFQALGDTSERQFHGKLIAATNRDLAHAMQQGQFREDFYYRLCSDVIHTPALGEQLSESPQVLHTLVLYLAQRLVGQEADSLAQEVETWIRQHLGPHYPWAGNIRELEQCVRNVLIRQEYRPLPRRSLSVTDALAHSMASGQLTADDLLRQYCTLVYAQTGSYEETARRVQLDRRTVKSKIDASLLQRLRATA